MFNKYHFIYPALSIGLFAAVTTTTVSANTNNTSSDTSQTKAESTITDSTQHVMGQYYKDQIAQAKARLGGSYNNVIAGDTSVPAMDAVDVASFQGALTVSNYQAMKKYGVKYIIVKLTEGTSYTNPLAKTQIKNAQAAGLTVAVYHFSRYSNVTGAKSEATYFSKVAQSLGLSKSTVMINDLESLTDTNAVGNSGKQAFYDTLKGLGYANQTLYTNPNYINTTGLNLNSYGASRTWMATYPYTPSKNTLLYKNEGYGAWQWNPNTHFKEVNGVTFDVSTVYQSSVFNPTSPVTPTSKNGWITENGVVRYYQNGKAATGYLWISGHMYYFNPSTGAATKGIRYYGNHKMEYYGSDFKQVRNAYVKTGNTYYYLGAHGDAVQGVRKHGNGKLEFYGSDFKQVRNAYVKTGNTYYYMKNDGDAFTGIRKYGNGKLEYYGSDFKQVRNAYVKTGNTYYYMKNDGDAFTGIRKYGNGKLEYYGSDFKQVRNKSIQLGNKRYTINKHGDVTKITVIK